VAYFRARSYNLTIPKLELKVFHHLRELHSQLSKKVVLSTNSSISLQLRKQIFILCLIAASQQLVLHTTVKSLHLCRSSILCKLFCYTLF